MNIEAYNPESLRKLVRSLQKENKELKSLLTEAAIPYSDSEVFKDSPIETEEYDLDQGSRINELAISEDIAIWFFSMFWGREDVFAKRAKGGNYYPQCEERWNDSICPKQKGEMIFCEACKFKNWKKLTPKIIVNHLRGRSAEGTDVIGVYPLLQDGTCRFLVFDFDNHEKDAQKNDFANNDDTWHYEVDALRLICRQNGVDALVERSRSGKGAHVWILFSKPIPSSLARDLISQGWTHYF